MPRKLRLEYEGAIYHVMNRGDRREDIFLGDEDRRCFLKTLEEVCSRADWQVYAYCLMRNHFHLVMETPRPNLSAGMQWFLGTYTTRFNQRHKYSGHLFSGRYKTLIVDGSGNGYLKTVCDYVHLNPVRARLLKSEQRLRDYRWSSYPEYLKPARRRAGWLRVEPLLGEWRITEDTATGRQQFEHGMEERKKQEHCKENEDWKCVRQGWCWGQKTFREALLGMVGDKQGEHYCGEELIESAEQKAQRLISRRLAWAGWKEGDLTRQPKGAELKVLLASQLRAETTMSWKWIAERLQMGHWRSAANAVRSGRH